MKYAYLFLLFITQFNAMDREKIREGLLELAAKISHDAQKARKVSFASPIVATPAGQGDTVISEEITFKKVMGEDARFRYRCSLCPAEILNYKMHARYHTGLRPYKCACGRDFTQNGHFNRHQKMCDKKYGILKRKAEIEEDDATEEEDKGE